MIAHEYNTRWSEEAMREVATRFASGETYTAICKDYGVTTERIRQVVDKYARLLRRDYPHTYPVGTSLRHQLRILLVTPDKKEEK